MNKRNWRELGIGMVVPLLAIALWQWVAAAGLVNPQVLPAPAAVWRKWVEYLLPLQPMTGEGAWLAWALSSELVVDTAASLYRVVVGFAIGAGLALPLGLAQGVAA